jgi:hypothetical protein
LFNSIERTFLTCFFNCLIFNGFFFALSFKHSQLLITAPFNFLFFLALSFSLIIAIYWTKEPKVENNENPWEKCSSWKEICFSFSLDFGSHLEWVELVNWEEKSSLSMDEKGKLISDRKERKMNQKWKRKFELFSNAPDDY